MPSTMIPCGGGGEFGALMVELEGAAAAPLATAAAVVADFCNMAGDFAGLAETSRQSQDFEIDCSAAAGAGRLLSGAYPSYTPQPAEALTLAAFIAAQEDISVVDPGVAVSVCTVSMAASFYRRLVFAR